MGFIELLLLVVLLEGRPIRAPELIARPARF